MRQAVGLFVHEVLLRHVVREHQPTGRGHIGRLINCVDLVFGRETLRHDFKLQLTHGAQHQVAEFAFKDLNGTFFTEFLQPLVQLLPL